MANVIPLNPFNGIFGLPPASHVSDDMIINSMPTMEITPGTPQLEVGLSVYTVNPNWEAYNELLAYQGYKLPGKSIKLAFIADSFPTDTFTNDYSETFLQKFTDVASQGMAEIMQMTGARSGTAALDKFKNFGVGAEEELGGIMGGIAGGAGRAAGGVGKALTQLKEGTTGTTGIRQMMGNAGQIVDKMIAGHRVDFPMIWRNSGFTPSYTATIRLYNPNPGSDQATKQYIIGPLAVILCLGTPQSDDGKTYSWPFFHKIKARGIYNLDPAVITNITVIKGGDQQQIAYNQRLAMVDVRIDFGSLYTSMVAESKGMHISNRPTVKGYLDNLSDIDSGSFTKRNKMNADAGRAAGATKEGQVVRVLSARGEERQRLIQKNNAIKRRLPPTVSQIVQASRVPAATKELEEALALDTTPGFLADEDYSIVV